MSIGDRKSLHQPKSSGGSHLVSRATVGPRRVNEAEKESLTLYNPEVEVAEPESFEENNSNSDRKQARTWNSGEQEIVGSQHLDPHSFQHDRKQRARLKDEKRLSNEKWPLGSGHSFTYAGVFLFTLVLYFRPYEWIPGLSGFDSMALFFAIGTILIYLPSQLSSDGKLTVAPTEIKCVLFLIFSALLSIPIAIDPAKAWLDFKDFGKVVIVFVVMVNVVRTRARLFALIWLAIGSGVMLSYQALGMYQRGEFKTEGYRVSLELGGMFGNPNDMALHLVIFIPIAVAFGVATRRMPIRLIYFTFAILMTAGTLVTQSRGGFLGLLTGAGVLAWKFGRTNRVKTIIFALIAVLFVLAFAPGDYGVRLLSIFVPSLDPVGSSSARSDLLTQSIWVSLRNPFGIGIGNFSIVGSRDHVTHNAYTQVSSEIGLLAFVAYLILLVVPLLKLAAIERQIIRQEGPAWVGHISIGLQASIAAYMVSSFFGSVAFLWYVYYPIAFAISLRRINHVESFESQKQSTA